MLRTETADTSFGRNVLIPYNGETAASRTPTGRCEPGEYGRRRSTVTSNTVLSSLPVRVFDRLFPLMKRVTLLQEEFLFQPDDDVEFIYFPESAAVSEFRILEDGRIVEVAVIGRDGAIGLSKLFHSASIQNCVQVLQAGNAVRMNSFETQRVIKQDLQIAFCFYPHIDSYIRRISQKIVCNLYHSVRARFCTWLLMVRDRCDQEILRLTHEQIAKALGVYRPRITSIARELKNRNIIHYSRGGITVLDRPAIESLTCVCYEENRDRMEPEADRNDGVTVH